MSVPTPASKRQRDVSGAAWVSITGRKESGRVPEAVESPWNCSMVMPVPTPASKRQRDVSGVAWVSITGLRESGRVPEAVESPWNCSMVMPVPTPASKRQRDVSGAARVSITGLRESGRVPEAVESPAGDALAAAPPRAATRPGRQRGRPTGRGAGDRSCREVQVDRPDAELPVAPYGGGVGARPAPTTASGARAPRRGAQDDARSA